MAAPFPFITQVQSPGRNPAVTLDILEQEISARPLPDMKALMEPRSAVVVGMSSKPGSPSWMAVDNLVKNGFAGDIHLVGRSAGTIDGRPCVASIDEIPEGVDLAILLVAADAVLDSIKACIRRKVKSAICFASGFAEMGEEGRIAQAEIGRVAAKGGLALLGPNTVGYFNHVNPLAVSLVQTSKLAPLKADAGPAIGIIAQSGGVGTHVTGCLIARNVPVSYVITTGNEACIGLSDIVRFYAGDEHTGTIAIYVEQIRHPQELLDAAALARAKGKRIVMLHPGRSAKAQAAAASHTGAMAGNHAAMRTIAAAAGILVVETIEELVDIAELLLRYPDPVSGGLGIVTASGAICSLAEDYCDALGLDVPALGDEGVRALADILPSFLLPKNPLDVGAAAVFNPDILRRGVRELLADPAIGCVLVSLPFERPDCDLNWMEAVTAAASESRKPLIYVIHDEGLPVRAEVLGIAERRRTILLRSPERAIRALDTLMAYYKNLLNGSARFSAPQLPPLPSLGKGAQPEWLGKHLLSCLDIAVPRGALVKTAEQAVTAAREIGYPVVMKAQAAKLAHKSEAGGVLLNIAEDEAACAAFAELYENVERYSPGMVLDGVLVEEMGAPGVELLVGARRDPSWGPVVMVGMGGIWVELLHDVRLLPPALSLDRIIAELEKLKGAALFKGFRGKPPVDLAAVAHVVSQVSALMAERPEIVEIDVNPLMAYPTGALALDALIVTEEENGPTGSTGQDAPSSCPASRDQRGNPT